MPWHGDGHMFWMILWWILGAALVAVIIWGVLRASRARGGVDSPEQILERRYAKGEIDEETYERMRRELRK